MSIFLEISQLDNGDVVLKEADSEGGQPIVRICFSEAVQDMLGGELVGVAEAMIDAATDFLDGLDDGPEIEGAPAEDREPRPVIH